MVDRYQEALTVVRERTKEGLSTSTEDLIKVLNLEAQSPNDASRIVLRLLDKLVREGLAFDEKVSTGKAKRREFWAVEQCLRPTG